MSLIPHLKRRKGEGEAFFEMLLLGGGGLARCSREEDRKHPVPRGSHRFGVKEKESDGEGKNGTTSGR